MTTPTTSLRERVNAAIERLRAPALMFDSDRRAIADELEAALTAPASPPALEGMDLLRPTPMRATSYGTQEPEYRMDAYWYGFSPTGLDIIDTILSAVACAGKGYHSTEQWNEDSDPRHDRLRGTTPVAHIQNAANDAAAAIRAASPAAPAQPEGGEAVALVRKLIAQDEASIAECDAMAERIGRDEPVGREITRDAAQYRQSAHRLKLVLAELTRPVAAQQAVTDGYREAFYEIAEMLGVPAPQAASPREVYEAQIEPRIAALVASPQPAHVKASAEFLLKRLEHARCDSDAVSDCVRCNVVVVTRHMLGIKPPPIRYAPAQPPEAATQDESATRYGIGLRDEEAP